MTETQAADKPSTNVVSINDDLVLPGVNRLDELTAEGYYIEHDGLYWCLYTDCGDIVASGKSIKEMIVDLAMGDGK